MNLFMRLNKNRMLKNTARYRIYPQTHDVWPKPYNIHDNLDPNRKYIGLKEDEYFK